MIKKINEYYLNMPVKEMFDLRELSLEEYKTFESAGIKRIFKDEKIYNGKDINFVGAVWNTLIGATEGRTYKISLQNISSNKDEADRILKLAYDYLFKEMGKHSEYNPSTKRYFWETGEGNVILSQQSGMGMYSVQLFITSSIISQQVAGKGKELYDAWKTAENKFRAYTSSISFFLWKAPKHSDQENTKWSLLRGMEWGVWPAFLSGPVVPLLLLFIELWKIILVVGLLTVVWSFIRYKSVNVLWAGLGCYWSWLSWVTVPVGVIILLMHKSYLLAFLALVWPHITAFFGLLVGGAQAGRIQNIFMEKLGYSRKT